MNPIELQTLRGQDFLFLFCWEAIPTIYLSKAKLAKITCKLIMEKQQTLRPLP